MRNKRIAKILGIGLSVGMVFALIGAIFAAPVAADEAKWSKVNTPSWKDLVVLFRNDILDYDIGGDGDIIYAVLETRYGCNGVGDESPGEDPALVKSDDGGVTWTDITANVTGAASLPTGENWRGFVAVAVAQDDEDWVAVAGYADDDDGDPWVVASKDGGDNFTYTGDMVDGSSELVSIFDLAVSMEIDGIHNIAVAGEMNSGDEGDDGTVFRLKAGTWLSAGWEDTRAYDGWDDDGGISSDGVIAIAFSPNFDLDDTIC